MKKKMIVTGLAVLLLAAMPGVGWGRPGGRDVVAQSTTWATGKPVPDRTIGSWPTGKPVSVRRAVGVMTGFDSITYGATGSVTDSYRDELSTLFNSAGFAHRFIVTAQSGSRCTQWASQMPALLSQHNPGVVLINCGTNDPAFTVEDRELLGQSYRQIIEAIHDHNPYTKILISLIQISRVDPEGSLAWLPDNEIRANEVIAFNAGYYIPSTYRIGLVDFSVIPTTVENNPDGIHPGPIGEQLYADAWFAAGRDLGWW